MIIRRAGDIRPSEITPFGVYLEPPSAHRRWYCLVARESFGSESASRHAGCCQESALNGRRADLLHSAPAVGRDVKQPRHPAPRW
jgi:hypothetical protein